MSAKRWITLCLAAASLAFVLPGAASAETCTCFSNTVYFLEDTVHGTNCTTLGNQLVFNLNTSSDADCVNRGYDRSCADQITLHQCTLSGGQVHRYGFIAYSCANCFPGPDDPS